MPRSASFPHPLLADGEGEADPTPPLQLLAPSERQWQSPQVGRVTVLQKAREFRYADLCGWRGQNRAPLPTSWSLQIYLKQGCEPQVTQNLPSNVS